MFRIRLLKWEVACLLITSLIFSGRIFAFDEVVVESGQSITIDPAANETLPADNISSSTSNIDKESSTVLSSPPSTIYSRDVIINEVLPAPKTAFTKEYVELYNKGSVDVDLSGWWIDDVEGGGKSPIELNLTNFPSQKSFIISPQAFILFEFASVFNNTSDSVRLVDPALAVAESMDYTKAKEDKSYSMIGGEWVWTAPSPLAENIAPVEEKTATVILTEKNIQETRALSDGETVLTRGRVTVLPGAFSTQFFYIEDTLAGIQIYSYYKSFPAMKEGDIVTVTGELSTASGERRIKIDSSNKISIISAGSLNPPITLELSEIVQSNLGRYLQVSGNISATSGDEFTIAGADNLKIIIKDGTGIKKPKMRKGDRVTISGILTRYNETFRILPIHQNDVKIMTSDELPEAGPELFVYIDLNIVLYLIFVLWNISRKARMRLRISQKKLRFLQREAIFLHCLET